MSLCNFATCAFLLCAAGKSIDTTCDQDDHTSLIQLKHNVEIGTQRSNKSGPSDVLLGPISSTDRITCGYDYTCAASAGRFACWGNNDDGQFGAGNRDDLTSPPEESNMVALGNSQLVAGHTHTCAVMIGDSVGQVKCWGHNSKGQLGREDTVDIYQPQLAMVNLGTGVTVKTLAAGDEHTCAICQNDQVKCWGNGGSGRLGNGNSANIGDGPHEMGDFIAYISLGSGLSAKSLALGTAHTCALLSNDKVKCWGSSTYGQLGYANALDVGSSINQMGDSLFPIALGNDGGQANTAKAVVAGSQHTCVILSNDRAKCWGRNDKGQLGYGNTATHPAIGNSAASMGDDLPLIDLGNQQGLSTAFPVKAMVAGAKHTCAILKDNPAISPALPDRLKCWGHNDKGQLGSESTADKGSAEHQMGVNLGVVSLGIGSVALSMEAGDSHTCVLLTNNGMKCWGYNNKGQLGNGNTANVGDDQDEMSNLLVEITAPTTTTAAP